MVTSGGVRCEVVTGRVVRLVTGRGARLVTGGGV